MIKRFFVRVFVLSLVVLLAICGPFQDIAIANSNPIPPNRIVHKSTGCVIANNRDFSSPICYSGPVYSDQYWIIEGNKDGYRIRNNKTYKVLADHLSGGLKCEQADSEENEQLWEFEYHADAPSDFYRIKNLSTQRVIAKNDDNGLFTYGKNYVFNDQYWLIAN